MRGSPVSYFALNMNPPSTEGHEKRKRLEFSISSDGSGDTDYSQGYYSEEARDSLADLLPKMQRTPSCVSNFTQCANQQKLDDLYKSYTKLKIYFCVLCVVNVIIILLVCIFFAVFFIRFSHDDNGLDNSFINPTRGEQNLNPNTGRADALSATTKRPQIVPNAEIRCSVLKHKLNATGFDSRETCSLEDMVDSIAKYLKPREYNGNNLVVLYFKIRMICGFCFLKKNAFNRLKIIFFFSFYLL